MLLCFCTQKSDLKSYTIKPLTTPPLSQIIKAWEVKFVKLPDSVQLGPISTLKITGPYAIVSSQYNSNNLICVHNFDYKYELKSIGAGPGEYISLYSYYCDTLHNELVVYDRNQMKLITYDLQTGKYRGEKRTEYYISNMELTPHGLLIATDVSGHENRGIYLINKHGTKKLLEWKQPIIADAVFNTNFSFADKLYFSEPFYEKCYRLEDNKLIPWIRFDFGERSSTKLLEKKLDVLKLEQLLATGNYSFCIHLLNPMENEVSFFYYAAIDSVHLGYLDMRKDYSYVLANVSQDLENDLIPLPHAVYQGFYVFCGFCDEVKQLEATGFWSDLITSCKNFSESNVIFFLFYRIGFDF